jgi:type IV pilus assembly protein PilP
VKRLGRKLESALLAAMCAAPVALGTGCGDETLGGSGNGAPAGTAAPKPAGSAKAAVKPKATATVAAAPSNLPPIPLKEFQEADFAETDRSRDPFRSFESVFYRQSKTKVTLQREVLIDRFALDELKLAGIITRGPARALLTDPTGLGWVTKVGDFIGKAELVHAGGPTGTDVPINWRIDRIRDGDVVFIREDPSHPEIPPTTRVISLHPVDGAAAPAGRSGVR